MLDELRNLFLRALKCDDGFTATVLVDEWNEAVKRVQNVFDNMTDKDSNAVPVVRCKDCKHRPTKPEKYRDGFDLEFPDGACPCKCEDPFYSWYPFDDWFCPRGKRKGE